MISQFRKIVRTCMQIILFSKGGRLGIKMETSKKQKISIKFQRFEQKVHPALSRNQYTNSCRVYVIQQCKWCDGGGKLRHGSAILCIYLLCVMCQLALVRGYFSLDVLYIRFVCLRFSRNSCCLIFSIFISMYGTSIEAHSKFHTL